MAETGYCTNRCTSDKQTPRPSSSTHHRKFQPRRHWNSFTIPLAVRCVRVMLSNLSTQFRPTQTRNSGFLPLPAPRADRTRADGSDQISPPPITHHIQCTKRHETFSKIMPVNEEHIRTGWVRYLVLWADLLLSHRYLRVFCR